MKIRVVSAVFVTALFLSACSTTQPVPTESASSATYLAPTTCDLPEIVQAFDDQVKGSVYVPTDWQPSPGSDLYDAINNGGIACTYGIQVAEVGGTVLFAALTRDQWDKKKTTWTGLGQIPIDLPGLDETDAVIRKEGSTGADEMHVWGVNLYIQGVWISVNASFLQNIDEAMPIINAAVNSLQKA
jgi:hypothetical protein